MQSRVLWGLWGVYATVLLRTAWLDDDCFITFRVVDNMAAGYGARWNVADRIQVFTHPLWFVLVATVHAVTSEFFFSVLSLSIALSLAAAWVLMTWSVLPFAGRALGLAALTLCTSFVDYSTSGLENPLTHLLLVCFFRFGGALGRATLGPTGALLLVGLMLCNREDTLLLVLPAAVAVCLGHPPMRWLRSALVGLSPLLAWKAFSLVYYGSLVPNTAHAKLITGMGMGARLEQSGVYFLDQLRNDPLSWALIAVAIVAAAGARQRPQVLPVAGMLLYLAYVAAIGGSFMLGRYFAAPVLLAVIALAQPGGLLARLDARRTLALSAALLVLGWLAPYPTLASGSDFGATGAPRRHASVSDERFFYYAHNGLLPALRSGTHTEGHDFHQVGVALRALGGVHVVAAAGMTGLAAGPDVHLVDIYGITDPLLARLPVWQRHTPPWVFRGVGHLVRRLPEGYVRSLHYRVDHLRDRRVAELHARLLLVTRAPLWSTARWRAIATTASGAGELADPLYARRYPQRARIEDRWLPVAEGVQTLDALPIDPTRGLAVDTPPLTGVTALDMGLHPRGRYQLGLSYRGGEITSFDVESPLRQGEGITRFVVELPSGTPATWDAIHIAPVADGVYASLAHVRPVVHRGELQLSELATVQRNGSPWAAPGAVEVFPHASIRIALPGVSRTARWDLSVDFNDTYALDFHLGDQLLGSVEVMAPPGSPPGLVGLQVETPDSARSRGYDSLSLRLVRGDAYCSVGHLVPAQGTP